MTIVQSFLSLFTDIDIGVENFMDCLDSGVHVCKLASLIHQRGLQAYREDPTLPGVSKPMKMRGVISDSLRKISGNSFGKLCNVFKGTW